MNILWCCPNCQSLNRWEDGECWNCLFSFDKELAKAIVAEEDISRGYRPIETSDGRYYFRRVTAPTTKQKSWWYYVAMLGRATSGKHMPMNEVLKMYKSLKIQGFSQGEILSILGG